MYPFQCWFQSPIENSSSQFCCGFVVPWSVSSNALNMSWMLPKYQTFFGLRISIFSISFPLSSFNANNYRISVSPNGVHSPYACSNIHPTTTKWIICLNNFGSIVESIHYIVHSVNGAGRAHFRGKLLFYLLGSFQVGIWSMLELR